MPMKKGKSKAIKEEVDEEIITETTLGGHAATLVDEEGSMQIVSYDIDSMVHWTIVVSGGKLLFGHEEMVHEAVMLFFVAGAVFYGCVRNDFVFKHVDAYFDLLGLLGATLGFLLILFLMSQVSKFGTILGHVFGMGQKVKNMTNALSMFGADPKHIAFVSRVARASLVMKFMQSRHNGKAKIENLVAWKILPKDEAVKLYPITCVPEEAIWMWNLALVKQLIAEGIVHSSGAAGGNAKGLVKASMGGQGKMNAINSELANGPPFALTHLLGLLVQIYNICYAVLQGFIMADIWLAAKADPTKEKGAVVDLVFAVLTLWAVCLLLFALEIIAFELSDPFSGDLCDLSMKLLQQGIKSTQQQYSSNIKHAPKYLAEGTSPEGDFSAIMSKPKKAKSAAV